MPLTYICDRCDQQSENSVILIGSKRIKVLCKGCWEQIENEILAKKEVVYADQR